MWLNEDLARQVTLASRIWLGARSQEVMFGHMTEDVDTHAERREFIALAVENELEDVL